MVESPVKKVVMCFSISWISVGQLLEQLRNSTGSFPVWYPGGCSIAVTWFCDWFPWDGDVWLATFDFPVYWVCCIVESLILISKLCWFTDVSVGLLPDNLGNSRKFCCFSGLRSVTCSSQVEMWRFWFKVWAVAWTFTSELFWASLCWTWFFPSGRLFRGCSRRAAFAPKKPFSVEWLVLPQVS